MTDLPSSTPPDPSLNVSALAERIGPALAQALAAKGFQALTRVQEAVLQASLEGRDLRISSQTGSGKTVAIGFILREVVQTSPEASPPAERAPAGRACGPRALVIVPTRELAVQVQRELSWLFAGLGVRVTSVTGGGGYRDELRALARGVAIVVGTPGRLLDHLSRGSVDAHSVGAVVLDEADQMLDLGFREDLEAIFEHLPESRRTHLVSATFARDVVALADRVQERPVLVEGTPLGAANADIAHIVHVIDAKERIDALVNVLLRHPEDQTLVFCRTRADVADCARELQAAGFAAGALSGEMDQTARHRALAAFKRGELRVLVATDVAARGIDVENIARVVQIDAPGNAESYTHRSGRTGRAGRKGQSVLLITKAGVRRTEQLLQRARVKARFEPVPTAESIRAAQDERMLAELVSAGSDEPSERVRRQVARIMEGGHTEVALAQLLTRLQKAEGEPREVRNVTSAEPRARHARERFDERPGAGPKRPRGPWQDRNGSTGWVSFRVSCGHAHGADARRLVAMLCRRGRISGDQIGAIRVSSTYSDVEVSEAVAGSFAEATFRTDPRDPRVNVRLLRAGAAPAQSKPSPAGKPFRGSFERGRGPVSNKRRTPKHKKRPSDGAPAA